MKIHFNISKIALLTGAIFLLSNLTWAQKDVLELLPGADKLAFDEKTGAQRLIGNLSFTYQGHTMFCDSAHFFAKTSEVRAYGNVHISKQTEFNLFCDSAYYNGKAKKAKLWGNVRVRDQEYKLTTDTLEYDTKNEIGVYRYGGRVESIDTKEILTSKIGYFYPKSNNLFFSGKVNFKGNDLTMTTDTLRYHYAQRKIYFYGPTNVVNKDSKIYCEKGWYQTVTEESVLQKNASVWKENTFLSGDSLYINPSVGISRGKGNVVYFDTTQHVRFTGNTFFTSEKERYGFLTDKAVCAYELKKDTLFIHADTLFSFQDSLNKFSRVLGHNEVRFFSTDFQGKCDTLDYFKTEDKLFLKENPIIWSRNAELKGDSMTVFLRDSIIDRVEINTKASAVMEVDSAKYYNQIAGKNMIAFFKDNALIKVDVNGNAQTLYYPEETTDKDSVVEVKRSGLARMYASDLKVYLDSGEVERILYLEKPDGVFYPMDKINREEQFIPGFSWNKALRPKRKEDLIVETKTTENKDEIKK